MELELMPRNLRPYLRALAKQQSARAPETPPPPLLEFIPQVSPYLQSPHHLAPLAALLERSLNEPVRALVSTPPQHTKTTTLLHGMAWLMRQRPQRTNAYVSYATDFARSKSRLARRIAEDARVPLDPNSDRLEEWRTLQGGGMLATGIGGPLTGHGINGLLLVDDPVKNRQEAESALIRERHWEWFNDVAFTRLHPQASVIVCMTRWHPDDLIGRLSAKGWHLLNLPAINEQGHALWPERYPLEALHKIRQQVGEYTWASLYLGQPRPRGGALFREPTYYDQLPDTGYTYARGFDLAYSSRKSADYSVIVSGRYAAGVLYLEDVWRAQVESPVFANAAKLGRGPMHIYAHGVERGVLQMFQRDHRLPIVIRDARDGGDKFARAQPAAAAWNAGRIRIPQSAAWLEALLSEVLAFTGVNDPHDDQVDALAALWDALSRSSDVRVKGEVA
jgi:predicted phage terminase large subunit-like protein